MKKSRVISAFCLALAFPLSATADPSVGIGLSFVFGGGKVDTGIGLRLFSDDRQDRAAASIGADFLFKEKRIRPTIGAAYLGKNTYIGLDMGFGLNGEGIDFGLGVGGVNTKGKAPAAAAPAAPVAPAPVAPTPVVVVTPVSEEA